MSMFSIVTALILAFAGVVLLGPVHRVPVRGLATVSDEAFATPLGQVPIDREALASLADLPQVSVLVGRVDRALADVPAADLVVLDGDPFDLRARVELVFVGGRVVYDARRQPDGSH